MAKETFYFSHDYNSRSDRKMVNLLMKTGVAGVGIYWCIVEMLYEEGGYLMLSECERIAFELRTQSDVVQSVIDSALFAKDSDKFWSESVLRRLEKRKEKSAKARESALSRWGDANALRPQSESNANKVKESKGEESKELNKDAAPAPAMNGSGTSVSVATESSTFVLNGVGGRFQFSETTELPGTYLESAERNQFTLYKQKNTEFLQDQWKQFLHERGKDPTAYYPSLGKLADHFVNWVRTKRPPKNGRTVKTPAGHYDSGTTNDFFNNLSE